MVCEDKELESGVGGEPASLSPVCRVEAILGMDREIWLAVDKAWRMGDADCGVAISLCSLPLSKGRECVNAEVRGKRKCRRNHLVHRVQSKE